MIEIVNAEGYNDGWYWDYRVWFNCDKKPYTYISGGSCSGYWPCIDSIAKGHLELQKGVRNEKCIKNVVPSDEYLEEQVKRLLESGKDVLEDSDDD
jgi:hypothetical protein